MVLHINILSWALIFILRLPFPTGKSIATILNLLTIFSCFSLFEFLFRILYVFLFIFSYLCISSYIQYPYWLHESQERKPMYETQCMSLKKENQSKNSNFKGRYIYECK